MHLPLLAPLFSALAASALLVVCAPHKEDHAIANNSASTVERSASDVTVAFISTELRFAVRFPNGARPTSMNRGVTSTVIGDVSEAEFHTANGNTAYAVTVWTYPNGKLPHDIPGLLKVMRDESLRQPGFSLLGLSPTKVQTDRGAFVEAERLDMQQSEKRVMRVTCFFGDRAYSIAAGGILSDPSMAPAIFDEFVASFLLLDGTQL